MSSSQSKSKTVCFNVGGTKYEVSRSLLESFPETMLARMASETWQSDPDSTLFIERDGENFRYVLHYMRDGKVHFPGGRISKQSLLDDLTYYGFKEVDPSLINVEFAPLDAPSHIAAITQQFEEEVGEIRKQRDSANLAISCLTVAHACCIRYLTTGRNQFSFSVIRNESGGMYSSKNKHIVARSSENELDFAVSGAIVVTQIDTNVGMLNQYMAKYGLKAVKYHDYVDVAFPVGVGGHITGTEQRVGGVRLTISKL